MKHIRYLAIGLLSAATLSACAARPPGVPATAVTPTPVAPVKPVARLYDDEAAALAAYPATARRDKDKLVISYEGKDVAAFSNVNADGCEGYDTCSIWTFEGLITIGSETYAAVGQEQGEGFSYIVVDRHGQLDWIDDSPIVSPDGRYIANGSNGDGYDDSYVSIMDWQTPRPRQLYMSTAGCQPVRWNTHNQLELNCTPDGVVPGVKVDKATATKSGDHWTIAPGSYAPLTRVPETPPMDKADLDAWQVQEGYQRLVP